MRILFYLSFCFTCFQLVAQNNYVQYVNPMIGTGGHGHTFPGATLPFSMIQLSPDTRIDGSWDGCSGYHYSDSIIYGFSHTHLSGTGCSDYGDIAFLPTFSANAFDKISADDTLKCRFSHKNEFSKAGYYEVKLDNEIKVELTATTRVGLQQYSYEKSGYATITLNLKHRDELLEGKVYTIDKHTYSGYRRSKAWAQDQLVFFCFEVSKDADTMILSKESTGDTKLTLRYRVKKGDKILIKTALSSADFEGAKNNLKKEMPGWDFEQTKENASSVWNKELNRIKVYGGSNEEKVTFYTALYHCMIHPNVMNDVDGRYRGRDQKIHTTDGYNYYTVFSLWDTYRALHPLLNVIDKERSRDFILTFKDQFEQGGRLPMWELWGNETNCMIGFHSVSVIWDAFCNDVIGSETLNALYTAVKTEAMSTRFGLSKYRTNGFLSIEDESESVSKTLEYSYDMYCVANIAYATHHNRDADYFIKQAEAWKNVYDSKTCFMRPRKNGGWLTPFDPKQVNNHYTEANAWQYSFAVPQHYNQIYDIHKLSELFNTDSKTTGREQSDISGLIGQYAQGNEPSHHIPYLFNNTDSTAKYVKKICDNLYKPTADGLCGNEDCGQMSAWYVFSAMGFYPAQPSSNKMVFGNMLFDSVSFSNGNDYSTIYKNKKPASHSERYTKSTSMTLISGRKEYYFGYDFLYNPDQPEMPTGVELSAPIIEGGAEVFNDSMTLTINTNHLNSLNTLYRTGETKGSIYYTLDGSVPTNKSMIYTDGSKLVIKDNSTIKAIYIADSGAKSAIATARYFKKPNNYSIKINSTYNKQYTADGDEGLLDGLIGDNDWRKGRWQGYQAQDFEAIIDLKTSKKLTSIKSGFLQDTRSWILFPTKMQCYGSVDGINYEFIGEVSNTTPDKELNTMRKVFEVSGNGKSYRFVKVKALNYGLLPAWHQGAGGDAFIFIDEITVD